MPGAKRHRTRRWRSDPQLWPRVGLIATLAAVTGALVAGLLLPVVGSLGMFARHETNYFDSLSTDLCQPSLPQTSTIVDVKGNVIAHFYAQNRRIVRLSQVPQVMQDALLSVEDVRFYADNGIDLKGALRALLANGASGSVQQGGSTLTQQYVKNVLEACHVKGATSDTLARKIREAAIALHLARTESKSEILQGYLNIVNFGDGAYGIGAAAEHFFHEPVSRLTLDQSALLAGLVQAPTAYNPRLHPQLAKERRNVVLGQMLKYQFIDQAQYDQAIAKPLGLHIHRLGNGCSASRYPWFCSYVENVLLKEVGRAKLLGGGLTVHTTLNPKAEQAAEDALRRYVPPDNAARVTGTEVLVHPGTGHIEAIAQSSRYGFDTRKGQTSINNAVDAPYGGGTDRYSVGSTFKLFVLAAALKEGLPLGTTIYAPPSITVTGYTDCNGLPLGDWQVHNAGAGEAGRFNLVTGTWDSVNTFFAQLERRVGVCQVAQTARALGVKQGNGAPVEPIPAMALGAQAHGLSALDMANAYATVAAHGRYCPPVAITRITNAKGQEIPLPPQQCTQVLDPHIADTITGILEGVLTQPGATASGVGDPGRVAAAKTGTADNDSVSAFAGFVPQLAGFVWVGHTQPNQQGQTLDGVTLGATTYGTVFGATIAGPIWRQTFEQTLAGVPVEPMPPAVTAGQAVTSGKPSPTGSPGASTGSASPTTSPASGSPSPSAGTTTPVPPPAHSPPSHPPHPSHSPHQ